MNFKKKHSRHTVARKSFSPTKSVGEWSRMLHRWWMKDVLQREDFKKGEME